MDKKIVAPAIKKSSFSALKRLLLISCAAACIRGSEDINSWNITFTIRSQTFKNLVTTFSSNHNRTAVAKTNNFVPIRSKMGIQSDANFESFGPTESDMLSAKVFNNADAISPIRASPSIKPQSSRPAESRALVDLTGDPTCLVTVTRSLRLCVRNAPRPETRYYPEKPAGSIRPSARSASVTVDAAVLRPAAGCCYRGVPPPLAQRVP